MKQVLFLVIIVSLVTLGTAETVHVGPYLASFYLAGDHSSNEIPPVLKSTNDASYTTYSTEIKDSSHVLTIQITKYSNPMDTSLENEKRILNNSMADTHSLTFSDGYIDKHQGVLITAVDSSGQNVYGAAYWIDPYSWVILISYYPWDVTSGVFGSLHITTGTSNLPKTCQCTPGSCRQVGNNMVCNGGSCSCNNGSPGVGVGGLGMAVTNG